MKSIGMSTLGVAPLPLFGCVMSGDDGPETRDILLQVIAEDERAKRCSDLRATREGQIEGAR